MCEARPRRARASTHVETSRRLSDAAQPKSGGGGAVRSTPPPPQRPCVSLRMWKPAAVLLTRRNQKGGGGAVRSTPAPAAPLRLCK